MRDDSDLSPEARARSFHHAGVGRRALTVLAGPGANFLLSIVIFAFVAMMHGRMVDAPVIGAIAPDLNPEFAAALAPGDRVVAVDGAPVDDFAGLQQALLATEGAPVPVTVEGANGRRSVDVAFRPAARVDAVVAGSAAAAAGLRPGDVIVAIDGAPIDGFSDLQRRTRASGGATMTFSVRRDGETFEASVTPEMTEVADPLTGATVARPILGVQKQSTEITPVIERSGPIDAVAVGIARTWDIVDLSLRGIADVIAGRQDAREVLGGPIRIAEVSGQAAGQGLGTFVGLIAVLSTSIGLINLFPIPVLDGGHLVFYAIEKLRGRPLRDRWMEIGNGIGLGLVLLLMAFATFNDLARL
jgi:regulator of sigma E protease